MGASRRPSTRKCMENARFGSAIAALAIVGAVMLMTVTMSSPESSVDVRLEVVPESDFVETDSLTAEEVKARGHETLASIVGLRAYCKLAEDDAVSFKEAAMGGDTAIVNFVALFGKQSDKKNVVTAYANSMGKAKDDAGIGRYLLDHISQAVARGKMVTEDVIQGGRKHTRLSAKVLGLTNPPGYLNKLAVPSSKFYSVHEEVKAANMNADAQAATAWLLSGEKTAYKSFKQREAAKVAAEKAAHVKRQQDIALKHIKANFAKTGKLQTLPTAGTAGADTVEPIEVPTAAQVNGAAKEAASQWLNNAKARGVQFFG